MSEEIAPEETIVSDDASDNTVVQSTIEETPTEAKADSDLAETPSDTASDTTEEVDKPKPKNRISAKDRIAQLTAKNKELERQNEKLQAPDPGDFAEGAESPEYRQQQIDHAVAQALQAKEVQQVQTQREASFSESLGKAAEVHGNDKVNEAFDFVGTHITNEMADVIKQSGNAGDIIVHLANNPEQLASLQGMSPIAAAMQIGQMSAGMSKTSPTNTVTKAPAPVTTVGSNNQIDANLNDENLSVADYEAGFRKKHGGSIRVT